MWAKVKSVLEFHEFKNKIDYHSHSDITYMDDILKHNILLHTHIERFPNGSSFE